MIITSADAKRLIKMVATRAGRAQSSLRQISNLSKNKIITSATIDRAESLLQKTLGNIKEMARILEDM